MDSDKPRRGNMIRWITDAEKEQIKQMASWHMTLEQMAALFKIAPVTLDRRMADQEGVREAYLQGKAEGSALVRSVAYRMATSGSHPNVTIFWLKCKENFSEKQPELDKAIIESLTDDELVRLAERAMDTLRGKDGKNNKRDHNQED